MSRSGSAKKRPGLLGHRSSISDRNGPQHPRRIPRMTPFRRPTQDFEGIDAKRRPYARPPRRSNGIGCPWKQRPVEVATVPPNHHRGAQWRTAISEPRANSPFSRYPPVTWARVCRHRDVGGCPRGHADDHSANGNGTPQDRTLRHRGHDDESRSDTADAKEKPTGHSRRPQCPSQSDGEESGQRADANEVLKRDGAESRSHDHPQDDPTAHEQQRHADLRPAVKQGLCQPKSRVDLFGRCRTDGRPSVDFRHLDSVSSRRPEERATGWSASRPWRRSLAGSPSTAGSRRAQPR